MNYGIENSIKKIIINTDIIDYCETFICKCSSCSLKFIMGCSDSKNIEYCPMCGFKVNVELVKENIYL